MKTLIIAEAGENHNGSLDLAYKLIDKAIEAGVDIVKFQTGKPELVTSKYSDMAEYQKENIGVDESQLEMLKKIMLPFDAFKKLKDYCDEKGIEFLSTPFDLESVDLLHSIGMKKWKIPSGEITNLPYLIKIANLHEPIILSTGMCELEEVKEAVKVLKDNGAGEITLLHCTTEYPAPYEDVNLKAMLTMKEETGLNVGYSDHTKGIEIPVAAVAMGATVIEKHFTLCHDDGGLDDKIALTPEEFAHMCYCVNQTKSLLKKFSDTPDLAVQEVYRQMAQIYGMEKVVEVAGTGKKILAVSEENNYGRTNRSLHYRESFPKGYKLQPGDVLVLRTEKVLTPGIHPQFLETVSGVELKTDVQSGEGVLWNHLL